ncbi:hypothetical protein LINGRAHAP2_LOCUS20222 [Linum grandiflorum]
MGRFRMVDLESEVFLATFDDSTDYFRALTGGPWTILGLGNLVGKFVRNDNRTQSSVRGKFAKIAVELNLAEPAPKGVFVDGVWQVIEYENLPSFCRKCGRFGHENDECGRKGVPEKPLLCPPSLSEPVLVPDPMVAVASPSEPDGDWHDGG